MNGHGPSIAVIPARGGSKRVPRKNIRLMSGRPLIGWSIETALRSGAFQRVIVSTDDAEIAEISLQAGAEIPFTRPAALAGDHATTGAVMSHAVEELLRAGAGPAAVCCIYPGAIFVTGEDLLRAGEMLWRPPPTPFVMAVAAYPHPVQRALRIDDDGVAVPVDPAYVRTRTQDLEPRWHDAGQFYWGTAEAWRADLPVHGNARAYVLDGRQVVDIDSEDDWTHAEWLHDRMITDSLRP
jgi:N-acylneuraminate cytidylyltransferase